MNHRHFADHNRRARTPELSRSKRWGIRFLVSIPPIAFLAAAIVYCIALGRLLRANLAPVVAGEASRQIDHQVKLGGIDFRAGELILHNAVVSSRRTFAASHGEAGVKTPLVTVHYNLHDLLFDSGNAAHAFGDIVISQPAVLVERFGEKQFNFTDVIEALTKRPPKPHAKPFAGRIIAHDATVHVRDYMAPAASGVRPAYNTVADVNATVDFSSDRVVYFTASGHGNGERIANFSVSGDASREVSGRFRVAAKVSDGDAAYWSRYFKAFPLVDVKTGRASLDLTVARLASKPPPGLPVDLLGRVTVRGGNVILTDPRFHRLPVQNVSGTALFTGSGITIDGKLTAGGQPVRLSGTVFDLTHPHLAFVASSPRIDLIRLARYFPQIAVPSGLSVSPAPLAAQITGTSALPVIAVQGVLPAVTYRGNTATNVATRALYTNNVLLFPSTTFRLAHGGSGTVRVTINTAPKQSTMLIGGRLRQVDLAALHFPVANAHWPALGGTANVAFLANNQGHPLTVAANVDIDHPRVAKTVLKTAQGRVAYSATSGLTVNRAVVEDNTGGVATASGTIALSGRSAVKLTVNGSQANLARLLAPYNLDEIGGLAYFQGHISGPLAAPVASANIQVFGGRYKDISTDVVTGTVSGNADRLQLKDMVVRRFPTTVRLAGNVSEIKSGNPKLALDAALSHGYLSDVVAISDELTEPDSNHQNAASKLAAKLPPLSGLVTGSARITGHAKSLQVAGHVSATHVMVSNYNIKSADADLQFVDDTLGVSHVHILSDTGASATGQGSYSFKSGSMSAAVHADDVNLDELDFLTAPYADVAGMLNLDAQVSGTAKSPTGSATIDAKNLVVEGQSFAPFTASATYANGVVTKTGAPLVLELTTPKANGAQYIVDALRVALPTPEHPNSPRTMDITAQIPENAPENFDHLIAAVQRTRWNSTSAVKSLIAKIDSLPAPPKGTVWAPAVSITGKFAAPAVTATVDAKDLSAGDYSIGGLAVQGNYAGGDNPSGRGDLTASDLHVGSTPIQSLTVKGAYQDRIVSVSTLHATSDQAYLDGSGKADLDGAINAELDASNVPLSLFNIFLPAATRLSGQIGDLTVAAYGETKSPNYVASVNLDHPAVTLTHPAVSADTTESETRYGIDSIRSSKITLAPADPKSTNKVLAVSDLSAFNKGERIATLSGTLPLTLATGLFGSLSSTQRAAVRGNVSTETEVSTDTPLHAELQIADLSALDMLGFGQIDPSRTGGSVTATVDYGSAGGTETASRMFADVNITNASLGLKKFDTSFTKVSGHILARNVDLVVRHQESGGQVANVLGVRAGAVDIPALTAQSSKGGSLTVTGEGQLGPEAPVTNPDTANSLVVTADAVKVDESGRSTLLATLYKSSLKAQVDGKVRIIDPWRSPLIQTDPGAPVVVSNATATLPSAPEASAAPTAPPFIDPAFNVKFLIGAPGKTVSVRSSLLQAEANGNLELTGTLSSPSIAAHVNVAKGQFYLPPATRLAIVRPSDGTTNTVDIRYPVPSPDPADNGAPTVETRVHLVARANVAVSQAVLNANSSVVGNVVGQPATQPGGMSVFSQGFNQHAQRYTITARIDGLLNVPDRLTLNLSSDPAGLTKSQMLASLVNEGAFTGLLGGGQGAETALKQQLAEALNAAVIPNLLSPIEEGLAGALGLQDFTVDYTPDAPVNVTLSKEIGPRLLLTYIRAIGSRTAGPVNSALSPQEYRLTLGYSLTKHFQISISTDDQHDNTIALESVLRF